MDLKTQSPDETLFLTERLQLPNAQNPDSHVGFSSVDPSHPTHPSQENMAGSDQNFGGFAFSQWSDQDWDEFIQIKFSTLETKFENFLGTVMSECQRVAQGVYTQLLN